MRVSSIEYFYREKEREGERQEEKEGKFGRHTDKCRNYCRFDNANVSKSRRKLCIGTRTWNATGNVRDASRMNVQDILSAVPAIHKSSVS